MPISVKYKVYLGWAIGTHTKSAAILSFILDWKNQEVLAWQPQPSIAGDVVKGFDKKQSAQKERIVPKDIAT